MWAQVGFERAALKHRQLGRVTSFTAQAPILLTGLAVMDEQQRRRISDRLPHDIEQMIMQEDDHKQRAFLIVLNSINNSLIANTHTIQEVSDKLETHLTNFETHAREEEAVMNKGRGAWKVAAWVVGVVQVVGLAVWADMRGDMKSLHADVSALVASDAQLTTRVAVLEKRK